MRGSPVHAAITGVGGADRKVKVLGAQSRPTVWTPWTVARQAPLSVGLSRQAYWTALPLPSPGDLSDAGIEPGSPALQAQSLPLSHQGSLTVFCCLPEEAVIALDVVGIGEQTSDVGAGRQLKPTMSDTDWSVACQPRMVP